MPNFDWQKVAARYSNNPTSRTKKGCPFKVAHVEAHVLYIDLPSGQLSVSRKYLEKAVHLINAGRVINGPADYKRLVYDERPAYAWAILRDMGFVR